MSQYNAFHNARHGTSFKLDDYTSYGLSQIWNINEFQIRDEERMYFKSDFYKKVTLIDGAYDAVEHLSREYRLRVVTGRGVDAEEYLAGTLSQYFKKEHFSSVDHIGLGSSTGLISHKWEKCQEYGAPMLVDDYHMHLVLAAQHGIHGILIRAPWNIYIMDLPPLITRARNLSEAVDIIEKKKNLWCEK